MIAAPQQLQNGGLKLPPFPTRDFVLANPTSVLPKADFTEAEANAMKTSIYVQLDEFDGCVSFYRLSRL